jgi:sugar phosphate isomerase/epimerase
VRVASRVTFAYYNRLSERDKRTYRKSDEITRVHLANAPALHALVPNLEAVLAAEERRLVESISQRLLTGLAERLDVPPLRVHVHEVRPSDDQGELHGFYSGADAQESALVEVWMRTARHRRVVAWRTFLRTLLHEFCHHLDFEHFRFEESFHTQGFYRRESSLFRQLVPDAVDSAQPKRARR